MITIKKSYLLVSILISLLIILSVAFPTKKINPKIVLDGKPIETLSYFKNNRILVPMREIFEQQGAKVYWDAKNQSVTVTKNEQHIKIYINRQDAYVNGFLVKLDVESNIINKKTYIPIRFVSESLGNNVQWKKSEQAAYISTDIKHNTTSPLLENYDVVVIGSEPEGVAAAVASSREGQKTLLISEDEIVGGLFTLGELNTLDMNYEFGRTNLLTRGIFSEFFDLISRRSSFDTKQVENALANLIQNEPNLTVVLSAKNILPEITNSHIEKISFVDMHNHSLTVTSNQFIDSTEDADIAALSGVEFTYGQQDYRGTNDAMCVTLVFELKGVNWSKVEEHFKNDNDSSTGADNYSAWGFGPEMRAYSSSQENVRIRGLNMGRQTNGNVLINALQILNINALNIDEIDIARIKAEKELLNIIKHIRTLPGMANAELSRTATDLYVRETRHMIGQYRVTIDDVLENRDFEDRIAFGSYPVDVQASVGQPDLVVGNPNHYSIPFRAIVPNEIDNLLVASRSASYDSLAHGSIRVVPVGMVVAEAAGVSAAYANKHGINFHSIASQIDLSHIKNIQSILNSKGANLYEVPEYPNPITEDWSYEGIKFLRKHAIIGGGYRNEYHLDKEMNHQQFITYLTTVNERTGINKDIQLQSSYPNSPMSKSELLGFLLDNEFSIDNLSTETKQHLDENDNLTTDVAYMIIYEFLNNH